MSLDCPSSVNITIQGAAGATGPSGPAGLTGPVGPTGATGSSGLPGAVEQVVDVASAATGGNGTLANPWIGWDAAVVWGTAHTKYFFRPGYYSYATSPNFLGSPAAYGSADIALVGGPGVILIYAGSGNAINWDNPGTNGTGALVYKNWSEGCSMDGFIITGNQSAIHGLFVRGLRNSIFRNISVMNVTGDAFHSEACVTNILENFRCTHHEALAGNDLFTTIPANGIVLTERALDGGSTTTWTILNPVIEGVSGKGIWMVGPGKAYFNTIIGGTSESNGIGLQVDLGCINTTIMGTDFEVNNINDFVLNSDVVLVGVSASSNVTNSCNFNAGHHEVVGGGFFKATIGTGAQVIFLGTRITGTYTDNSGGNSATSGLGVVNNSGSPLMNYRNYPGGDTTLYPPGGSTYTPTLGNVAYHIVLTTNTTIANPSNSGIDGQILRFRFSQGSVPYVVSWGTNYTGPGGAIPSNTLTVDATDYYTYRYNSGRGKWQLVESQLNL